MTRETATDLFLALTPDAVLDAVEDAGVRCTPACQMLNSFENRVYDVRLEDGERVVAKFYRPERWTREQILEEHAFMNDLEAAEFPVCGLRRFPDGTTLKQKAGIFYCLYPRFGGRAPEELDVEAAQRLGMLVARLHNVGAAGQSPHRIRLGADSYVRENVKWLLAHKALPAHLEARYTAAADELAGLTDALLARVPVHRIHGDFHAGNLLLRDGRFHVVDFDDMLVGPAVQDLWLLLPGRGHAADQWREFFLEGYEQFRAFDRSTLRLVEPLRGLRRVHYAAWLARRWHDPAFPQNWPHFGTESYWAEETADLEGIVAQIRRGQSSPDATGSPAAAEPELTNKDFFWDLDRNE